MALPLFEDGVALNMVVFLQKEPCAFRHDELPEYVWMSNLFGRATHNLVLAEQLRTAYAVVDQELETIAQMQRSLLPPKLPDIATLDLAVHYETSRHAGGDYYDFFALPDGRWGLLMADVSGHGTPAAVLMAIAHAIAHTHPEDHSPPSRLLERLNRELLADYTHGRGLFISAFYGVYDCKSRQLTYANAGHPPPRLKRCTDGSLLTLDAVAGLPLGIAEQHYEESTHQLQVGDQMIFYTDGITEAANPGGQMFGTDRLDATLSCCGADADQMIADVLASVDQFTQSGPADDDRTLLVAKVR